MSLSIQPAAYRDCYELFRRAADTPGGVRTPFPDQSSANYFQMRMNQSRVILRTASRSAYPPGHHLYNTSEFDSLKVQVLGPDDRDEYWIYIRPHGDWAAVANAEPIPTDERIDLPPPAHHTTNLQLTHESIHDQANDDLQD